MESSGRVSPLDGSVTTVTHVNKTIGGSLQAAERTRRWPGHRKLGDCQRLCKNLTGPRDALTSIGLVQAGASVKPGTKFWEGIKD